MLFGHTYYLARTVTCKITLHLNILVNILIFTYQSGHGDSLIVQHALSLLQSPAHFQYI